MTAADGERLLDMSPHSLVFDLDGTLWDTSATCAGAWNRVLERLGIRYREITEHDVRAVTGLSHRECIERVFVGLSAAEHERLCEETQIADNLAVAEHGGELYAGVRERIPELAARATLCIVSNCQRGYIETFLEWSALGDHFTDFECWGNTGRSKGDNLRAVIERNGLQGAFFIGDTTGDRDAARAVGVPFVHASYGFGKVSDADYVLERFDAIGELVG
jgi:phosphoglycolate phosphatase